MSRGIITMMKLMEAEMQSNTAYCKIILLK